MTQEKLERMLMKCGNINWPPELSRDDFVRMILARDGEISTLIVELFRVRCLGIAIREQVEQFWAEFHARPEASAITPLVGGFLQKIDGLLDAIWPIESERKDADLV